ncbi:MAG: isocitrate lyase, partial [Actinobacteria bacterium]
MTITERIRGEADELRARWRNEERWRGITRPYTAEDVVRLRGRIRERHVTAETSAA